MAAGAIWQRSFGFGTWGRVYFTDARAGFTLGGDGELFETGDSGATWVKTSAPERIVGLACEGSSCWAVGETKLYRIETVP